MTKTKVIPGNKNRVITYSGYKPYFAYKALKKLFLAKKLVLDEDKKSSTGSYYLTTEYNNQTIMIRLSTHSMSYDYRDSFYDIELAKGYVFLNPEEGAGYIIEANVTSATLYKNLLKALTIIKLNVK